MAKRLISPVLTDAFVPAQSTQLSTYPMKWVNAMSARFGKLIPIMCEEVLPKDHWKGSAYPFVRLEPLIKPILAEANVFVHFFFVPNRIIWPGWEEFIAGLDDEAPRSKPQVGFQEIYDSEGLRYLLNIGSLADYLGVNITADEVDERDVRDRFDLLPFLAYQMVYDHWYRNKNFEYGADWEYIEKHLHDGPYLPEAEAADGPSLAAIMQIHNRDWEPDYFTSSLPWPQRHDDVLIPFQPLDADIVMSNSTNAVLVRNASTGSLSNPEFIGGDSAGALRFKQFLPTREEVEANNGTFDLLSGIAASTPSNGQLKLDPNKTLKLSDKTLNASTIEDLRVARILQSFREIEGYAENDYQGQIEGLYGVRIPDYRIDKPELIGGGRQPITISEVLQMSASEEESAQGNLAGHAVSVPQQAFFEYNAYEHGFILGIMSIMPRTSYFQGLHRKFSRFDRFDYAWPQFATLGAQEVKNREIFISSDGDQTFGYQPRYLEYKVKHSEVHGTLKTDEDFWTLARKFEDTPILGRSFLEMAHQDVDDIFAVQDGSDPMQVMIKFNCTVRRALPYRAQTLV